MGGRPAAHSLRRFFEEPGHWQLPLKILAETASATATESDNEREEEDNPTIACGGAVAGVGGT